MAQQGTSCIPRWTLPLMALLLLAVTNNINWGGTHWRTVLQADAKGYHAYLPALVVHGDPHFGFMGLADSLGSTPALRYEYRTAPTGVPINKYWGGTALMQAPFYMLVHAGLRATGQAATGHGRPYVMAVCLAAIAHALLGLWAIARLLEGWRVPGHLRALTLAALLFGTHLFYYTIVAPGMSHVYSFALFALLLLQGQRHARDGAAWRLPLLGLLLGLLVLVRPVNGIAVLALPVVAGGRLRLLQRMKELRGRSAALIVAIAVALLIPGLQLVYYRAATGQWWVDSYPGEGFNWAAPHPIEILFSYRKGLFVYTPLCLLAFTGLWGLFRRSRLATAAWAGYFLLLTYVLSSWWNWWYGGSFSARPFVDHLALFALPLGLAINDATGRWRTLLASMLTACVLLCQVQTYQARYYLIHYEDMDRARYWEVFLRLDRLP